MFSLILKDLFMQKKGILYGVIYVAVIVLAFHGANGAGPIAGAAAIASAMVAVTYMLLGNACAYDDKSKADVVLNSLPLNRARIVAARYLSVYLFMAVGVVYYLLVTGAIMLARLPVKVYPLSGEGLLGAAFAVTLMNSIYLPTFFKWGYMRSRMFSFIFLFLFFFGGAFLAETVYKNLRSAPVKTILQFIADQPDALPVIVLVALIMAMMAISYLLSLKIYLRREF